jgi:hypothetical protein
MMVLKSVLQLGQGGEIPEGHFKLMIISRGCFQHVINALAEGSLYLLHCIQGYSHLNP